MRIAVHPGLNKEFVSLADRGFRYESAIGPVFRLIDERWVEAAAPEEALAFWQGLPFADGRLGRKQELRALDAPDGVVSVVVTARDGVLLLLAASRGLRIDRLAAVKRALTRVADLSWVVPEEE